MANIGKLTLQKDNTFKGSIHTLEVQCELQMVPCESLTDKHPVYRVYSGKAELGAAWENTASETGLVYYTLRLNDPSFRAPIYAKLFQDKTDGGTLHIVFD